MARTTLNFNAAIDDFVRETEERMNAVFRESAQRTISIAQNYLSGTLVGVQTGFLRASVRVSLSAMPPINEAAYPPKDARPGSFRYDGMEVSVALASSKVGDHIYIGWTAAYAEHVHDGTSKMRGRPFSLLAAQQWETTVRAVVAELKGRVGA
jgi:hypothetical protein